MLFMTSLSLPGETLPCRPTGPRKWEDLRSQVTQTTAVRGCSAACPGPRALSSCAWRGMIAALRLCVLGWTDAPSKVPVF